MIKEDGCLFNKLKGYLRSDKCKLKKKKLIIHCGTPKTGTSSLQRFFYQNQEVLRKHGVAYPAYDFYPEEKHQWLHECIYKESEDELLAKLKEIDEEIDENIKAIVLSTEGIYNHWWDYTDKGREILGILNRYCDMTLIFVFRPQAEYLVSLYAQYLKNPYNRKLCHGQCISMNRFLEQPRIRNHALYSQVLADAASLVGEGSVRALRYMSPIEVPVVNLLGIPSEELEMAQNTENISLSPAASSLLRFLNILRFKRNAKRRLVTALSMVDRVFLKRFSTGRFMGEFQADKINSFYRREWDMAFEKFGV